MLRKVFTVLFVIGTILSDHVSILAQQHHVDGAIVYNRDLLFSLRPGGLVRERPEIPKEMRRRCRAGAKCQVRKTSYKPYLPSITVGNVSSLANKIDELAALARSQREYGQSSVLCFMKTWLHMDIPVWVTRTLNCLL